MPRPVAVLYDVLLAVAGVFAFTLALNDLMPQWKVLKHLPGFLAALFGPLKTYTVAAMGSFIALMILRFVIPRQTGGDEGAAGGPAEATSALDYAKLDRDDPKTFEKIVSFLDELARTGAEIPSLVDEVILSAAFLGTSDIHVEPKAKTVKVAFRIDGIMKDITQVPKGEHQAIINRLKITSKLDIAKTDAPQDGRIEGKVRGKALNLRVSIFPTMHGEKAVIRVLEAAKKLPRLVEFGLMPEVLADFQKLLHSPQGMILFTGPTGSGKTTLMYSSLKEILEEEESRRNIVTLEDPIEQELEDVNQSQVDTKRGLTFAAGLRTLLRQDPDIIMVGEIRDAETAKIALQAGQTGHLILSTIHANSASAAFGRLIEMGIEPFLLSSAVSGVLAQRLVRRNCPSCPVRKQPPPALLEQIGIPPESNRSFYEGAGCADCNNTGYTGRIAIVELLKMNEGVAEAILRKSSAGDIEKAGRKHGMVTLLEDGLAKVQEGHTSLVELLRVVQ